MQYGCELSSRDVLSQQQPAPVSVLQNTVWRVPQELHEMPPSSPEALALVQHAPLGLIVPRGQDLSMASFTGEGVGFGVGAGVGCN